MKFNFSPESCGAVESHERIDLISILVVPRRDLGYDLPVLQRTAAVVMQLPAGDDVDVIILLSGFGQAAGFRDLALRLQRPVLFRIRTASVR